MHRKIRINEIAGAELQFLPSEWDAALIGFAERGGSKTRHVKACYGYQAMKAVLKERKLSPEQVYARIQKVFNASSDINRPLLVMRMKRRPLWETIRRNKYPTWELLNKAIIGLGYDGWNCTGIVYSKPVSAGIIQSKQSTNNNDQLTDLAQAYELLDESLIPLDLGHATPWFVTPVQ